MNVFTLCHESLSRFPLYQISLCGWLAAKICNKAKIGEEPLPPHTHFFLSVSVLETEVLFWLRYQTQPNATLFSPGVLRSS